MAKFIIYHQAPGGPKMYHLDTFCSVSEEKKYAKEYGNEKSSEKDVEEQISVIRNNLKVMFNSGINQHDYSRLECWMGYDFNKIETKAEFLQN